MNDETNTKPGADTAPPSRKTPAKEPQASAPAPPVVVLARATKAGVTIAGARVAKGGTVRCTEAVAKFHEGRGEAVILGTA